MTFDPSEIMAVNEHVPSKNPCVVYFFGGKKGGVGTAVQNITNGIYLTLSPVTTRIFTFLNRDPYTSSFDIFLNGKK